MGKAGSIAFMLSYNYPVEETFEMATLTQVSEESGRELVGGQHR